MSNGYFNPEDNADIREPAEIQIPVPWGYVSGKWWGPRDKQPILAIHGWQDNAGTWDNLAPLLPLDVALLSIDLPGHGLSSHYPDGMHYYIFWDGISLIRRIAKHFKWGKITLLGHSLGGALSFMYAASFPDDVEAYISVDIASPSVRNTETVVKNTGATIDAFLKYETLSEDNLPIYTYDEMIDLVMSAYKGSITKDSCKILMKRGMANAPKHLHKQGYHFSRDLRLKVAGLAMFSIDHVMEYATKITCRVLNLRANPGMDWDNPSYYSLVIDKIRESAEELVYHEVEGTHHVHLNEPEKIAGHIKEFLQK